MRGAAVGLPATITGSANSLCAMPILSSTHSIVSTSPGSTAKSGMLPCPGVLGSVRLPAAWATPPPRLFVTHEVTVSLKTRCHLPSCTTTVTAPLGGLVSVNLPSMPVYADAYAGGEVHPH